MTNPQSLPVRYRRVTYVIAFIVFAVLKEFAGVTILPKDGNWALSVLVIFALFGTIYCSVQIATHLLNRNASQAQDA
jgi:membrane glycosyltransferase